MKEFFIEYFTNAFCIIVFLLGLLLLFSPVILAVYFNNPYLLWIYLVLVPILFMGKNNADIDYDDWGY